MVRDIDPNKFEDFEDKPDHDGAWPSSRLTQAAVSQLFNGASTPAEPGKAGQIGDVIAELHAPIAASTEASKKGVAGSSNGAKSTRPPLRPRRPAGSRVKVQPRNTEPVLGAGFPGVAPAGIGPAMRPSNSAEILPATPQDSDQRNSPVSSAQQEPFIGANDAPEALGHKPGIGDGTFSGDGAWGGVGDVQPQDSLQAMLTDIVGQEPEPDIEETMERATVTSFDSSLPAGDLESQLAALAAEEDNTSEMPKPAFQSMAGSGFPPPPRPSAPPPSPGVVVVEEETEGRSWWKFWRR